MELISKNSKEVRLFIIHSLKALSTIVVYYLFNDRSILHSLLPFTCAIALLVVKTSGMKMKYRHAIELEVLTCLMIFVLLICSILTKWQGTLYNTILLKSVQWLMIDFIITLIICRVTWILQHNLLAKRVKKNEKK